ncbi:hypothetical protein GCM10023149_49170 [Mucilaginibacter gynuensis]|uniref:Uncharacterized protein n=1 Tax=Mucilaginibacter gynuensis TaxID=1302236 RepID=A0ABP8HFZ3_9SPHI
MVPIYFTVGGSLPVMIIPDTEAHVDGHPVLTYTYNIYIDEGLEGNNNQSEKESELLLEKKIDPSYLGHITVETPGRVFSYVADGSRELELKEIREIVDHINHYRESPGMWQY